MSLIHLKNAYEKYGTNVIKDLIDNNKIITFKKDNPTDMKIVQHSTHGELPVSPIPPIPYIYVDTDEIEKALNKQAI
jgi:hypothetical protein